MNNYALKIINDYQKVIFNGMHPAHEAHRILVKEYEIEYDEAKEAFAKFLNESPYIADLNNF
jgi:hypothetical protein